MENSVFAVSADAWEKKTWARVLRDDDNDRMRHLLQSARDPHTAAPQLNALADEVRQNIHAPSQNRDPKNNRLQIVNAALAAHPNTPPPLFTFLIAESPLVCRAFCANPIVPFLLREKPAFVADLYDNAQDALLNEVSTPPALVRQLAVGGAARVGGVYGDLQGTARLHVAFAGEAQSRAEWEGQANDFYRTIAVNAANKGNEGASREWFADLVELGLLPSWADGGRPFGPPWSEGRGLESGFYDVQQWLSFEHTPGSEQEEKLMRGFLTRKYQENSQLLILTRAAQEQKEARVLSLLRRMAHCLRENASSDDLREALRLWEETQAFDETMKDLILRHPAANDAAIIEAIAKTWLPANLILNRSQTPPHLIMEQVKDKTAHSRRFARRHPNAPPNAPELSRQAFFDTFLKNGKGGVHDPLISLTAALLGKEERRDIHDKGEHWEWTSRFEAVWIASVSDAPLPGDPLQRTGRELLEHLSRDPNRIVRGAAQARLADPDWRFTWAE